MTADAQHDLLGETLTLLPERALYWSRRRTLILADPHFGKAAAFRAGGIPVPEQTTGAMLARLDGLIARLQPERLLCLGDLIHARTGRSPATLEAIAAWRVRHSQLAVELVRGNHDARAGDPPDDWQVRCMDEPAHEPPFAWRHTPAAEPGCYVLAGHLHPAVRVAGAGRQSATLACFYFGCDYAVLPAFGDFTGTSLVHPQRGETVYLIAGPTLLKKTAGVP